MKKVSLVLVMVLFACSMLLAQGTVRGTVSDDTGSPLIGVNIVVKNTTNGVATDYDGTYSISAKQGEVLLFSYTGYATQEVTVNSSTVDVVLKEEAELINEVVITASGVGKEQRLLGYSATKLKSDQVSQVSEPDPIRALTGKVAGVNITGSGGNVAGATNIFIRGKGSLTGDNQPLFVVDGIPYDNSSYASDGGVSAGGSANRLFDLDPNNVESMNVLKGAAASALYGSRAANGVIVITTKANNKRAGEKGIQISLNASTSLEEVASLPEYQKVYTQGSEFNYSGGTVATWGEKYSVLNAAGGVPHPLDQTRLNADFPQFKGVTIPLKFNNNADAFFQTGRVQEYGLNLTKGGSNSTLNAGFSYLKNDGIVPFNQASRTSFNFGGNAFLESGFSFGGSISYSKTDIDGMQIGTGDGTDAMTRLLFLPPNYDLANYPFETPDGRSIFYRTDVDNPLWSAKYSPQTSKVDRWNGVLNASYRMKNGLSIGYRAGYNGYSQSDKDITGRGSTVSTTFGRIITDDIGFEELDGTLTLNYEKELSEDFSLAATALHNVNQRTTNRLSFLGTNFVVEGIRDINNTVSQVKNGGGTSMKRLVGAAADVTLTFKNWLSLNAVARNDWASTLPAGNRSFFYPGISVSADLTTGFPALKNDILNYLKVRAAWARTGSEGDPYLTSTVFTTGSPYTGATPQYESNRIGNSALVNQLLDEKEFGIETSILKERISVGVTYYDRLSKDNIFTSTIPGSSGYTSRVLNVGRVSNKGWEVSGDIRPINTKGFKWDINTQFSKNVSLVEELGPGITEIVNEGFIDLGNVHRVGLPYGQIIGSDVLRHTDGTPLISQSTGLFIEDPDLKVIGDPNPDFNWSFTNTVNVKGFFARAMLDWRQGGDVYSLTTANAVSRGVLKFSADRERNRVINGYVYDPDTGKALLNANGQPVPNQFAVTTNEYHFIDGIGSAGASSWNVYDATTVRLREVALGYNFDKDVLKRLSLEGLSVSLTGRNLWFWTPNMLNDMNMDPETNIGQGNNQGLEFASVPSVKRYSVNLSIKF